MILDRRRREFRKDTALIGRISEFISIIPQWMLQGIKEIIVFSTEYASMYVESGADGEYFANTNIIMLSSNPKLATIEQVLSHEIGHHVLNNFLTPEQKFRLWSELGDDWKEDFASCFGFYFDGRIKLAKSYFSYCTLMELLSK